MEGGGHLVEVATEMLAVLEYTLSGRPPAGNTGQPTRVQASCADASAQYADRHLQRDGLHVAATTAGAAPHVPWAPAGVIDVEHGHDRVPSMAGVWSTA